MAIDDKIRHEKLQHDINRTVVKISALSSGNIYIYEQLTGGEIINCGQIRVIEQSMFTYSPLGKTFEK